MADHVSGKARAWSFLLFAVLFVAMMFLAVAELQYGMAVLAFAGLCGMLIGIRELDAKVGLWQAIRPWLGPAALIFAGWTFYVTPLALMYIIAAAVLCVMVALMALAVVMSLLRKRRDRTVPRLGG